MIPLTPRSTLFPYTTLFRSIWLVKGEYNDGVCTHHVVKGETNRFDERAVVALLHILDEVYEYFCVGFAEKRVRSEEHTSELQSRPHLVCRLLLEKKKPTHEF